MRNIISGFTFWLLVDGLSLAALKLILDAFSLI
jgi:hypothetical protein